MARVIGRLSARAVASISSPGRYADGGNLYLSISANGGRRWTFMWASHGRQREIGLGSARTVPLAKARQLAKAAHEALIDGKDPRSVRKPAGGVTFGDAADALVESLSPSFRNEKHKAQWVMTLAEHAAALRPLAVDRVTTEDVLKVLKPLWQKVPETASRLRGRIERVLDAAKARGWRDGENPARWKGHLDALLPRRAKLTRGNHAALSFAALPAFLTALRTREGMAALALEFTVLTAARTGEVIGARWSEIDRQAKIWTIPASRMKAGREHRVPLTDRALQIIEQAGKARNGEFVFPGHKPGSALSGMAMTMTLRRLDQGDVTVHGFRSTFRDWAGETTSFPREIAEAALAHTLTNRVEAAYRRGDAFEKRKKLMTAWANFCAGPATGKVVALRA